jgi:hypothetical protein
MPSSPTRMAWSLSALGFLVKMDGSPGVDLGDSARNPITHCGDDRSGPGQPVGVGNPAAEGQRRFGHGQWNMVVIRDRFVGLVGRQNDLVGVAVDPGVILMPAVVHPHLVSAGTLRHDADERRALPEGANPAGKRRGELAEVVGRDRRGAEVMLRIVGQNRDRPALGCLDREHGQGGIDGTGRRYRVGVQMPRMHVGSNGSIAERVVEHPVRAADPAAGKGVLVIVDRCPAQPCGNEIGGRSRDCLGNSIGQERNIGRVGRASEGPMAAGAECV